MGSTKEKRGHISQRGQESVMLPALNPAKVEDRIWQGVVRNRFGSLVSEPDIDVYSLLESVGGGCN